MKVCKAAAFAGLAGLPRGAPGLCRRGGDRNGARRGGRPGSAHTRQPCRRRVHRAEGARHDTGGQGHGEPDPHQRHELQRPGAVLTGEGSRQSRCGDRIVEITRSTAGVQAVQNEIALKAPSTLVARTKRYAGDRQGEARVAAGRATQRRAGQGGHRAGNRLPHGTPETARGRPGNGDCAARVGRSARREGRRVHRVTGRCARQRVDDDLDHRQRYPFGNFT